MSRKLRVGIVGVGNCASSLVQGVSFYRDTPDDAVVPGLMHVNLGGYRIGDIEFASAFDISAVKVGRPLGEALAAEPNNTMRFAEVPANDVIVSRGPTLDGLGSYLKDVVKESNAAPVNVAEIDKSSGAILSQAPQPTVTIGSAWAFAFWGGDFWLFTNPSGITSQVDRYQPSTGQTTTVKQNVGLSIVGAGVSTCAPIEPPS